MQVHKIKIYNQALEVKFDEASFYRYSNIGGNDGFLEGKEIPKRETHAFTIKLIWSMLKGNSAEKYPTCEDLAYLIFPPLLEENIAQIAELALNDINEMNNKLTETYKNTQS